MKRYSCLLSCLALAACPLIARAEHARIDLRLVPLDTDGAGEVAATADQEPPAGGRNERPVATVKAGEPLALQFVLTNTFPHDVKKDVTVKYFVAREEKLGQKELPEFKNGTVVDGHFTMNFKPGCRVGSRVLFTITEPGLYLLRVETLNTDSDHEHFSAIDVQVDKAP